MVISIFITSLLTLNVFAEETGNIYEQYIHDGYKINYEITDTWSNGFTTYITVYNSGTTEINGWALKCDSNITIANIWNAVVYKSSEDYLVINNDVFNANIPVDSSITFGYTSIGEPTVPEDITLSQLRIKNNDDMTVNLEVKSEWDDGFIGNIEITNNSENDIVDWQLAFGSDFQIVQSDDLKIVEEAFDYYTIEGTYNYSIPANSTINLSFTGTKSGENPTLYLDYLSKVVPYYDISGDDLSQYYRICNYSNEEFPLDMNIVIDENTLDFDMYNMQTMGMPYWNTDNLAFNISMNINGIFTDIIDYEFILCDEAAQAVYPAGAVLSDINIGSTYYYNLNVTHDDESIEMYAGSITVYTSTYNEIYIINDFSEVEPPKISSSPLLKSAYGTLTDYDYNVTYSSTYNNESLASALNMRYTMTYTSSKSGKGLIINECDADYYAIQVPANSQTTVSLYEPSSEYHLFILDANGQIKKALVTRGNKATSFLNTTAASITYYILICGAGWEENGTSIYYNDSSYYSLNITNAKNSRIWFGQQEYKVGTYEFWNADILQKLYINNSKYFTVGWSSVTGDPKDLMEAGCNLTALAMVLRNLGKTTVSDTYDFRTSFTGKLPADPYTVMLSNIGSYGTVTRNSTAGYTLSTTNSDPMSIVSYADLGTDFNATISNAISLTGTDEQKATTLMNLLNNGYNTQGIVVRVQYPTCRHSIVIIKSNTPKATNPNDRFYVYDPASSNYSDGLHKWSFASSNGQISSTYAYFLIS